MIVVPSIWSSMSYVYYSLSHLQLVFRKLLSSISWQDFEPSLSCCSKLSCTLGDSRVTFVSSRWIPPTLRRLSCAPGDSRRPSCTLLEFQPAKICLESCRDFYLAWPMLAIEVEGHSRNYHRSTRGVSCPPLAQALYAYKLLTSLTRYRRNSVLCLWRSFEMPLPNVTSP